MFHAPVHSVKVVAIPSTHFLIILSFLTGSKEKMPILLAVIGIISQCMHAGNLSNYYCRDTTHPTRTETVHVREPILSVILHYLLHLLPHFLLD